MFKTLENDTTIVIWQNLLYDANLIQTVFMVETRNTV